MSRDNVLRAYETLVSLRKRLHDKSGEAMDVDFALAHLNPLLEPEGITKADKLLWLTLDYLTKLPSGSADSDKINLMTGIKAYLSEKVLDGTAGLSIPVEQLTLKERVDAVCRSVGPNDSFVCATFVDGHVHLSVTNDSYVNVMLASLLNHRCLNEIKLEEQKTIGGEKC